MVKMAFLIIVCWLLSSCQQVLFVVNGVKRPKTEDAQSQQEFLTEQGMQLVKNLTPTFEGWLPMMMQGQIFPTSVAIYDRLGRRVIIPEPESSNCGPDEAAFILNLHPAQTYRVDSLLTLQQLAKWVHNTDSTLLPQQDPFTDFTVFVTWTKWMGKRMFRDETLAAFNAARSNTNAKIRVYLINMDKQHHWGEDNLKRVKYTRTTMALRSA
jgi:hypothetical protein